MPEDDSAEERAAAAAKPSARVDSAGLELSGARFDLRSAITNPVTIALAGGPPLAFASLGIGLAARRRYYADHERVRRRRATRVARARLRRVDGRADLPTLAGSLAGTLTDLAADWFGRARGSLTSAEATLMLTRDADPTAGELGRLLAYCDEARFGGAGLAAVSRGQFENPLALKEQAGTVLDHVAAALEGRA